MSSCITYKTSKALQEQVAALTDVIREENRELSDVNAEKNSLKLSGYGKLRFYQILEPNCLV